MQAMLNWPPPRSLQLHATNLLGRALERLYVLLLLRRKGPGLRCSLYKPVLERRHACDEFRARLCGRLGDQSRLLQHLIRIALLLLRILKQLFLCHS